METLVSHSITMPSIPAVANRAPDEEKFASVTCSQTAKKKKTPTYEGSYDSTKKDTWAPHSRNRGGGGGLIATTQVIVIGVSDH